MSRDQKPGKMRVVAGASATQARRREDAAIDGQAETPVLATGAAAVTPAAKSGKSSALLVILFLAGCAVGGAALPFLGVI